MTKMTKKRRQSKIFDLEMVCTPTKRPKSLISDACTSSSNKKLSHGITWSTTVPENRLGQRIIPRKGTPRPKKRKEDQPERIPAGIQPSTTYSSTAIAPSTSTRKNNTCSISKDRAIAIKSSRLAVDMARSRASTAAISLERAKRREEQAKKLLIEASSESLLAQQEHENATRDMKGAAEYLLELLQRDNAAFWPNSAAAACIGDDSCASRDDTTNGCKYKPDVVATEEATYELKGYNACDEEVKDDDSNDDDANEPKRTETNDESNVVPRGDVGKERPTIVNNGAEIDRTTLVTASKVASHEKETEEEEAVIENVKDKGMKCTYSKRMGSYTGQGRRNAETGEFERHGEGYMTMNGSDVVFRGDFAANRRHGKGSDLNAKGFGYTGEWKDDQKHGFGSTKDAACLSEGRWENDNRVGAHTYWFSDGKMCLKNHINNRDLCGPSLTFSPSCGTVKSFEDGVLEVVKPEMVALYVEQMGASVPSPRKL